jgi:hypothetical protein
MICDSAGMAVSPLANVLSPAQIAVLQQARAALARPPAPSPNQPPRNMPVSAKAPDAASPLATRGRGQIVNITV